LSFRDQRQHSITLSDVSENNRTDLSRTGSVSSANMTYSLPDEHPEGKLMRMLK